MCVTLQCHSDVLLNTSSNEYQKQMSFIVFVYPSKPENGHNYVCHITVLQLCTVTLSLHFWARNTYNSSMSDFVHKALVHNIRPMLKNDARQYHKAEITLNKIIITVDNNIKVS